MTDSDPDQKYIAIWSKAVDSQMHFNEMSVKSRQIGLAFVATILGISIVILFRDSQFSYSLTLDRPAMDIHVSVVLGIVSLAAVWAVRVLDLKVYHKMLRGAVAFGEDFEENYMKKIFDLEKGMTQAISHFSRHKEAGVDVSSSQERRYWGKREITTEKKIERFYRWVFGVLVAFIVAIFIFTNLDNIKTWI